MPFEYDLSNKITDINNNTGMYIRELNEYGVEINKYNVKFEELGQFFDVNAKNDIISGGIFQDFSSKYWMMSQKNKNRDNNNINKDDYINVPKYIYALLYVDEYETQIHELSENVIDINNDKYKIFYEQAKENNGELICMKYLLYYQSNVIISETKYRICHTYKDDILILTRIVRATNDYEFTNVNDNEYKYELVSNPLELDVLYDEGVLNV